jgi:uncharacterized damage-inducible protein DinB
MTSLSAEEVLNWNDANAQHWRTFLDKHTNALALPCDVRGGETVADLLQHIVAVELRYAERLGGGAVTDYAAIQKTSVAEIFATHDLAIAQLRALTLDAAYPWDEELELATRSEGILIATRRSVLFHALFHSIRHYAQLATLLRHEGIAANWQMDYIAMAARRPAQS